MNAEELCYVYQSKHNPDILHHKSFHLELKFNFAALQLNEIAIINLLRLQVL